ncbi:MAG TPA: ATP-binding protein [Candidatus Binataceae bacterium]|nr:ATP-binding protein [Candidatus Binataceae bacterium]HVC43454.1 ATP-binding protein [Candidatus Binataceae bacterium]
MELWQEIADSLSDAVIVLSPTYEPIAINAAAEAMIEASYVSRPMLGKLLRRNEWLKQMVDVCLRNGQSFDNPEATLTLDRRTIVIHAEVSPLIKPDGHSQGAIVLFHDLSHQKSAEQVIEAGENIFRLSPAGLAHEVKNPLTGIKGAAELLGTMFPADARAQQYCGLILDGVNRITALVEQVLAVSSPQRLKREAVNIHQVLHQALRMAGLFPDTDTAFPIEQDFDPSLPEVSGDAAALERVFLNLIRNAWEAVEATRGGGPAMAASGTRAGIAPAGSLTSADGTGGSEWHGAIRLHTTMETQFRLSSNGKRRQFLRVEVSDSGKGMSAAELRQLFTPFFTTKPSGTGLGLVLSQRIIALHGGKLWAERGGMPPRGNRLSGAAGHDGRRAVHAVPGHQRADGAAAAPLDHQPRPRGMTFCVMLPVGPE